MVRNVTFHNFDGILGETERAYCEIFQCTHSDDMPVEWVMPGVENLYGSISAES